MKITKRVRIIFFVFVAAISAFVINSCSNRTRTNDEKEIAREAHTRDASKRMIGKEDIVYAGVNYQIIEVDGKEYISNAHGGMCPLVKDKEE